MIINKFQGKTEEEATKKAKQELGEACVIMNVREIKPKGLLKGFKSSTYEVTAALEEKENYSYGSISKPKKIQDTINLAADENIVIPPPGKEFTIPKMPVRPMVKKQDVTQNISTFSGSTNPAPSSTMANNTIANTAPVMPRKSVDIIEEEDKAVLDSIERRLETMSSFLDERQQNNSLSQEEIRFIRLIYNTLLNHEVNEKYANQVIDEVERMTRPGNNVDMILSNIYQKLILRLGRPEPIKMPKNAPKVVFFVGPTGVGKTTTIAKVASKYKLEEHKSVALVTADTYRIAATEQLNVYADILDVPLKVVYSADELNTVVQEYSSKELIFVDTAGFSHKNKEQRDDVKALIAGLNPEIEKEVFLVLSATTKYTDLLNIADVYKEIAQYKLIFTKLDETDACGNLLNLRLYTGAELSYITNGQNVPNDIEIVDTQKIVKQLLGGN